MAHVQFVSDSAVMISFQNLSTAEANAKVLGLFKKLLLQMGQGPITNLHPAYQSLLVDFDNRLCVPLQLKSEIEKILQSVDSAETQTRDLITIPVYYGGEYGEDLEEVGKLTGFSTEKVIEIHSSAEYTVAFLGFSPGFPYLLGLPEQLSCPRKKSPRIRVPAGSVALAGNQTGIYPTDSPGGWQILGRTDLCLFDPHRNPSVWLKPGDRVRFEPNPKRFFKSAGLLSSPDSVSGTPLLKVESPGFFSSIQDQGRNGWTHLGVSPGGAADLLAFQVGTLLLGNKLSAAAIEMTAEGGTFTFSKDTWICVTGAACAPELDQQKIVMWTSLPVSAGQRLVIGPLQKGLRSYLHVYGGFAIPELLESHSTHVSGRWGGWQGRALQKGDLLSEDQLFFQAPTFRRCDEKLKILYSDSFLDLRVTRGPQWDWFSSKAQKDFFTVDFEVTSDVNRMGLRLQGPALDYKPEFQGKELTSEGIANGAIQVPSGGQALILFCEQRTTGGYAKVANVIQADLFRLGQIRPGQKLRFVEVGLEEAWQLSQEMQNILQISVREF